MPLLSFDKIAHLAGKKKKEVYEEYDIKSVLEYFVNDFEVDIIGWSYSIDPERKKIIFKLQIPEEDKEEEDGK